jgi:hypothetical protein
MCSSEPLRAEQKRTLKREARKRENSKLRRTNCLASDNPIVTLYVCGVFILGASMVITGGALIYMVWRVAEWAARCGFSPQVMIPTSMR